MKNNGFFKGALCGALIMCVVAGVTCCGISNSLDFLDKESKEKLDTINALIDKYYLYDTDEEALEDGLISGYVDGLEDPYSVYYDKEETSELYEETEGVYGGIGAGMLVDEETGLLKVDYVYDDSPAKEAGITSGDLIYKVDGEDMSGLDSDTVIGKIRGEKGSEVELLLLRGEDHEQVTVTCTRDDIAYVIVGSKMLDDQIGYIAISQFGEVAYEQFMTEYNKLTEEGMKGLIVDLRDNPGGSLSCVCDILDEILPEGKIVYTKDKNGKEKDYISDEEKQFDIPMEVLVNGNSASASEIFAGAVQDYGVADIIGTTTYGKGVVQQVFKLDDDTSLKLTVSEYFTPKGRSINGEGITPDIQVEYDADAETDTQLDKAMETLEKKLYN